MNFLTVAPIDSSFMFFYIIPVIQLICFITFVLLLRWNLSRKQSSFRFWFTMLFDHSWRKISPQKLLMRLSSIWYLLLLIFLFCPTNFERILFHIISLERDGCRKGSGYYVSKVSFQSAFSNTLCHWGLQFVLRNNLLLILFRWWGTP